MKEKLKKIINLENILCLLVILCPILDMASFIFRNMYNTNFSPSTFLRPIIPIIVIMYIFIKEKFKLKLLGACFIYGVYGLIHLALFNLTKTGWAYSGLTHELQYIVNYTFMILNLFIFTYVFNKNKTLKLKKSVLISLSIYIISMFIAIFTKTSSATYQEVGIGHKGWFESGNSISSIFILGLFIILNLIKEKKIRLFVLGITLLIGIYLTTLIGTRVGLFGFILVAFSYGVCELASAILKKVQLNKYVIIGSIVAIVLVVIGVGVFGSSTLERRKMLEDAKSQIQDTSTNQEAHLTGDLIEIVEKIKANKIKKEYMSEAEIKSVLDLYNFANEHNIKNTDCRMQQLVYNIFLVKNQANLALILFGNGYILNFYELVMEMEIPAFLLNFGLIGFILYFVPFLAVLIYAVIKGIKNYKKIDSEFLMLICGLICTFALAFLSGYTFFNSSTMIIIVVICALLINKCNSLTLIDNEALCLGRNEIKNG